MNRRQALDTLYSLLASSEQQLGGMRALADSTARAGVRVGTHAVSEDSAASLWSRLAKKPSDRELLRATELPIEQEVSRYIRSIYGGDRCGKGGPLREQARRRGSVPRGGMPPGDSGWPGITSQTTGTALFSDQVSVCDPLRFSRPNPH